MSAKTWSCKHGYYRNLIINVTDKKWPDSGSEGSNISTQTILKHTHSFMANLPKQTLPPHLTVLLCENTFKVMFFPMFYYKNVKLASYWLTNHPVDFLIKTLNTDHCMS